MGVSGRKCVKGRVGPLAIAVAMASGGLQAQESSDRIEEVVVSGQKIERSLQDTAASVVVYDEFTIVEQNFVNLTDVLTQTANVSTIGGGGGFSIRGLANGGASPGDQTSDVSAVYLDGAFVPNLLYFGEGLNLWDIAGVEVFRGPQSTIQGRNALAGAVVATTVDPNHDEIDGRAQLSYGDYNTIRTSGAVSLPLIEGQAGLRLSYDRNRSDGFTRNPTLGGRDDIDQRDATTYRAKLLLAPEAIPQLEVRLMGTIIDNDTGEDRVELGRWFAGGDRISNQNVVDETKIEAAQYSGVIDYDFENGFIFTSATSYVDADQDRFFDPTNDARGANTPGTTASFQETFSQEFRLTYQGERLTGLLGLYAFDSSTEFSNVGAAGTTIELAPVFPPPPILASVIFQTPMPDAAQITQAEALTGQILQLVPEIDIAATSEQSDEIRNYAIFGEATYDLTDRWRLTLGARYDIEEIEQTVFDSLAATAPPSGVAQIDQIVSLLAAQVTTSIDLDADNDFSAFLPKAVLEYAFTDDLSTSFSVQRAYRAGGLSFNFFRAALPLPDGGDPNDQAVLEAAGIVNSFDPEFTWTYELALRSQWLDRRLTVNANAFYIDYEDQQINLQLSNNPLDRLTENVGTSRQYGFEIESSASLSESLDLFANLGFVDTEFTSSAISVAQIDLDGLEFANAPPWTFGIGGRYTHSSGFYVNVRTNYRDEAFAFIQNFPDAKNDSVFLVDTLVGYQHPRFTAEVFANNLFDEEYVSGAAQPAAFDLAVARVGPPRLVGVRVVAEF